MNPLLLVTGGSRGIGAATARLAAARGWDVAVNCTRDTAAAEAVAADVRGAGRRAWVLQADMADDSQVQKMFARLGQRAGVVDAAARVDDMDIARWQRMFAVNAFGSFSCSREAVRRMSTRCREGGAWAAAGGHRGGVIDVFTIGLGKAVAAEGIRVNAVRPSLIETEIHASGGQPDRARQLAPQVPMQRTGSAEEVAAAIVWLLSDEASDTTGALLDVAGGR